MLALTALSAVACCGSAEEPLAIIPVPQETVRGEGHFEMPEVVTYATDLTGSERDDLRSWMSVCPVAFAEAGDAQSAVLTLSLGEGAAPESYRLEIAPARIAIAGGDAAGCYGYKWAAMRPVFFTDCRRCCSSAISSADGSRRSRSAMHPASATAA